MNKNNHKKKKSIQKLFTWSFVSLFQRNPLSVDFLPPALQHQIRHFVGYCPKIGYELVVPEKKIYNFVCIFVYTFLLKICLQLNFQLIFFLQPYNIKFGNLYLGFCLKIGFELVVPEINMKKYIFWVFLLSKKNRFFLLLFYEIDAYYLEL